MMTNAERQKNFRSTLRQQNRVSAAFVISGEASVMLADLAQETGYAKNLVVEQIIRQAHSAGAGTLLRNIVRISSE